MINEVIIMIPALIHFIWLGSSNIPYSYIRNISICSDINKTNYLTAIWTDNHGLDLINKKLYSKEIHPAGKADLLRLEILYHYGGIYSDCDITWYRSMDYLHLDPHKLTVVQEQGSVINNAFMAAPPKHPVVLEMINRCESRSHHKILSVRYGPGLLMDVHRDYPASINIISNTAIANATTAGATGLLGGDKVAYHAYRNSWFGC
jgi:mannosyltransferase OCH1-like enzyme